METAKLYWTFTTCYSWPCGLYAYSLIESAQQFSHVDIIIPISHMKRWGLERLIDFFKVIQLIRGRAQIGTWFVWVHILSTPWLPLAFGGPADFWWHGSGGMLSNERIIWKKMTRKVKHLEIMSWGGRRIRFACSGKEVGKIKWPL